PALMRQARQEEVQTPLSRPPRAVALFREARARYQILEREDWCARLEQGALRREQVARVRRTAYEALVWLAYDSVFRGEDHQSRQRLSARAGARAALAYLRKAEQAHPPTRDFYGVRLGCWMMLRDEEAKRVEL